MFGLAFGCLSVPPPPGQGSGACREAHDFVEVVAGADHSCGRTTQGAVRCWGGNDSGQLGTGNLLAAGTPIPISGNVTAAALAAGNAHTCALDGAGQVWCWGANGSSQLGNGDRTTSVAAPAVVRAVGTTDGGVPLGDVVQIAAGGNTSCALLEGGEVWCWGANGSGQAGVGEVERSRIPLAERVVDLPPAKHVALGASVGCAITVEGALYCWGSNGQRQLGDLGAGSSPVPLEIDLGGAVVAVALDQHTCAVLDDGGMLCWGDSDDGVLGVEVDQSSLPTPVAVALPGGPEIVAVTAGDTSTCVVTGDGRVLCWGANAFGQLGAEQPGIHTSPIEVELPGAAVAVSAGQRHTCAVLDGGGARCWGSDHLGQLGQTPQLIALEPVRVEIPFEATHVGVGDEHTCVADTEGRVHCWGVSTNGKLGGGFDDTPAPRAVAGVSSAIFVAAGDDHTCAISETEGARTIWCWGKDTDGQVTGDGSSSSESPQRVAIEAQPIDALSVFDEQACAAVDGSAICWGAGHEGIETLDDGEIRLVAAGRDFGCASDGRDVRCWGDGDEGQLGDGERESRSSPVTARLPDGAGAIEALAAGRNHVLAIAGGTIYGWGRSGNGELGAVGDSRATSPIILAGIPPADAAALAEAASCVRASADGGLWCFGLNHGGRLGTGSATTLQRTPSPVPGLEGVTSFGVGDLHGCATTEGGELWCWGSDRDGRRGHGRELSSYRPVAPLRCDET
jgi:alpha-tubulin suppressor-like RCC1 family protein